MFNRGINRYRQTDVITADPKRLVIMCYQQVIDNLKTAKKRSLERRFEEKAKAVQKAQDFLNILMQSVNFDKGGEIAKNLDSLYSYMIRRIIYAEANRSVEPLDEVVGLMEELKEAWEEISYGAKKGLVNGDVRSAAYRPADTNVREPMAAYGLHK